MRGHTIGLVSAPAWLDIETLLAACDGEAAIYDRVRGALRTALPKELAVAIGHLERGDLAALRETAHRLHGTISVASSKVAAVASELEDYAADNVADESAARVARLQELVPPLLAELEATSFEHLARWSS